MNRLKTYIYGLLVMALCLNISPSWTSTGWMSNSTAMAQDGPTYSTWEDEEGSSYVPGEILIKFRTDSAVHNALSAGVAAATHGLLQTGEASFDALAQTYGIQNATPLFSGLTQTSHGLERTYKMQLLHSTDLLAAVGALGMLEMVEYAEPNYRYQLSVLPQSAAQNNYKQDASPLYPTKQPSDEAYPAPRANEPNDPLYTYQWGLTNVGQSGGKEDADVGALDAWQTITGTSELMIAVIDSGVDYHHEDLDDGRVRTDIDRDFVNDDHDAMDDNGHGTHVAGTIAAETNNEQGVAGVMWQAEILPLKVCGASGGCATDAVAEAIQYAADQGAKVINLSLGGFCSQTTADAINYAYAQDVVIVAAAGNNGGSVTYPAKYPPVIAVGAVDHLGVKADFSNYGYTLDLAAPGVNIFSTVPNDGYDAYSGTSMAAPHVSGVVGLIRANDPHLTSDEVRAILRNAAQDVGAEGRDTKYGAGIVNAAEALKNPHIGTIAEAEAAVCSGCSATTATLEMPSRMEMLQLLWQVEELMQNSNENGPSLVRSFARHSPEVSQLLIQDQALRSQAQQLVVTMAPMFRAKTHASSATTEASTDASTMIVSQELVHSTTAFKDAIVAQASPALQQDLERYWLSLSPARFVGLSVEEAWAEMEQVSVGGQSLFLPLVIE